MGRRLTGEEISYAFGEMFKEAEAKGQTLDAPLTESPLSTEEVRAELGVETK